MRAWLIVGLLALAPGWAVAQPPERFDEQVIAPTLTVENTAHTGGGSGTIIGRTEGFWVILTAAHVLRGQSLVSVSDDNQESWHTAIVGAVSDENVDLGIAMVPVAEMPDGRAAMVAPRDTPIIEGDDAWTIGAGSLLPVWADNGLVGPLVERHGRGYRIVSAATIGGDSGGGVYIRTEDGFQLMGVIQGGPPGDGSWLTLAAPLDHIWTFLDANSMADVVNQPAAVSEAEPDDPVAADTAPVVGPAIGGFERILACDTAGQVREIVADPSREDFWHGQIDEAGEEVCGRWAIRGVRIVAAEPVAGGRYIVTVARVQQSGAVLQFYVLWEPGTTFTALPTS